MSQKVMIEDDHYLWVDEEEKWSRVCPVTVRGAVIVDGHVLIMSACGATKEYIDSLSEADKEISEKIISYISE